MATIYRIDLGVGSDTTQGGRKGFVEPDFGIVDTTRIFVAADHQRLPGRLPEKLNKILVLGGVRRMGQFVEAQSDIGFGPVFGQRSDNELSVWSLDSRSANCIIRFVDTKVLPDC